MAAPSRWTCPSEDTLFRFSTGDASRWERARFQRHLDRCAACAARLDGWEAATAAYRAYVNAPPAVVDDSEERARLARLIDREVVQAIA
jgi:anti-sigma factor RsiW